jgi:hypothetical protein
MIAACSQRLCLRNRWFVDSALEGSGFELPVPRQMGHRFATKAALGHTLLIGAGINAIPITVAASSITAARRPDCYG